MTTDAAAGQPVASPEKPAPDFPWMRVPTQRGMRPAIGPQGLRIGDIDQGSYGYVPDHWTYRNDLPRGAFPGDGFGLEASYSLYDKDEVWSDNAAELYEDAIRDRWASATDIPWDTLTPQSEIIEGSICQILTEISEASLVCAQIYSGWLEKISYGFYEVKSFLATQIYDTARHHEALRKRCLANGGGLGVESPGIYHRAVVSALRFTELVIAQNVVRDLYLITVLEALHAVATSDADRTLYELTLRDLRRHLDYGVGHLDFYAKRNPTKIEQLHIWLGRAELLLVSDVTRDTPFNEALILLLGDTIAEGREKVDALRRRFVAAYLNRLHQAGIYDRIEKLMPALRRYLPEDAATPTTIAMNPPVADPLAAG